MMDTRRKAVFFDRDGVLNEDDGYVHQMRKLRWVKGAREIVAELTKAGFLLFVVTNGAGISQSFSTVRTFPVRPFPPMIRYAAAASRRRG